MTAAARFTKADLKRAINAAKEAGGEEVRVIADYVNGRLEIIVGKGAQSADPEQWDDDDV